MEIEFTPAYFVYIVTNDNRSYFKAGITTSLRRLLAKPLATGSEEAAPNRLLYFEQYPEMLTAIRRETELAFLSQRRLKKLVQGSNPELEFITKPVVQPGT